MLFSKDRIGALLLLAFCAAYWRLTYDVRMLPFQKAAAFNAQTMPEALSVLGVLLSLALLVAPASSERIAVRGFRWGVGATMLALMVFYGATLRPLGFIAATTIFLVAGYMVLGERRPLVLVFASLPVVIGFWTLMSQVLDIYVQPWPSVLTAT